MKGKKIVYCLKSLFLRLWSTYVCPPPIDALKIPIVINNFNRLTTLKQLVASLTERSINNIIILDNDSTYPPLVEWYENCPYHVIKLGRNLGFKAIWKSKLTAKIRKGWFVYTDSDVVLSPDCPADIMQRMIDVMTKEKPNAIKVGPGIEIDDLPDCYSQKQEVIAHETKHYQHKEGNLYRAPIDTTFALYRPLSGLNRSRAAETYRLASPYTIQHLPWYSDSANPTPEEEYYRNACAQPTHWAKS